MSAIKVNGERLMQTIMTMGEIGETPRGGSNRQAVTDRDREGRDLFKRWCEEAGLSVEIDEMGNMFARRPGKRDDLPAVACGSHLDTQPSGGKYDGVAGVLCALEAVRTLVDRGIETDRPIEVVNWTNEEGTRFAPAMMASGVYCGAFSRDYAYARKDRDGLAFGDELARIGYNGPLPCRPRDWHCFFELHIEQGPILEAEEKVIGVVEGGQGSSWWDVAITGKDSHAGSTPIDRRKDALLAAAHAIAGLRRVAEAHGPHGVATVGRLDLSPGSRNVIPGHVAMQIDIRHPEDAAAESMGEGLREAVAEACAIEGLDFTVENIWKFGAVRFDPDCIEAVARAAEAHGYPARRMVSGAGHDACYVNRITPAAMIFIPCRDGLSHNEAEYAEPEHLEAGANVILGALLARTAA